jgi:hypothetical protein
MANVFARVCRCATRGVRSSDCIVRCRFRGICRLWKRVNVESVAGVRPIVMAAYYLAFIQILNRFSRFFAFVMNFVATVGTVCATLASKSEIKFT